MHEAKIMTSLIGEKGIESFLTFTAVGMPQIYWYGIEGDYNAMVMELLGPTLEDMLTVCGRKFSLKTAIMLAEQMVSLHHYS